MLDMPSWTPDSADRRGSRGRASRSRRARARRSTSRRRCRRERLAHELAPPAPTAGRRVAERAVRRRGRRRGRRRAARRATGRTATSCWRPSPSGARRRRPAESTSGLIAVAAAGELHARPRCSRRGAQYRFTSDKFDGQLPVSWRPTRRAQEALLVYPEGLPVDPAKGEYLHWRQFERRNFR